MLHVWGFLLVIQPRLELNAISTNAVNELYIHCDKVSCLDICANWITGIN